MNPFLQALVGDVRVVVAVPGRASEAELDAHIAEGAEMMKSARMVLVFSTGHLTAVERGKMARGGLFSKPAAILTDSVLARSIMTAIRWLGGGTQTGFAPDQFDEACDFLSIPASLRGDIQRQVETMRVQSSASQTAPGASTPLVEQVNSVKDAVDARLARIREKSQPERPKNRP